MAGNDCGLLNQDIRRYVTKSKNLETTDKPRPIYMKACIEVWLVVDEHMTLLAVILLDLRSSGDGDI